MIWISDPHSRFQDLRLDVVLIDESFHAWHLGNTDLRGKEWEFVAKLVWNHYQVKKPTK